MELSEWQRRQNSGFRNRGRNAVEVMLKAGELSRSFLRFGKDLFLEREQKEEI